MVSWHLQPCCSVNSTSCVGRICVCVVPARCRASAVLLRAPSGPPSSRVKWRRVERPARLHPAMTIGIAVTPCVPYPHPVATATTLDLTSMACCDLELWPLSSRTRSPAGKNGKGFLYSLPSVGPGADPGVQAVSPLVNETHPPGSRLPLLSARPAVTFPATQHHSFLAGTKLFCVVTEAHRCEQLAQGCYAAFVPSRIWPVNRKFNVLPVVLPRHLSTAPPSRPSEYSLSVLTKPFKSFMRYCGNNISYRTNGQMNGTVRQRNAFTDTVE